MRMNNTRLRIIRRLQTAVFRLAPPTLALMMVLFARAAAEPAPAPEEYATVRRGMITPLPPTRPGAHETQPDEEGRLIYEATSARPLVDGINFQVETNRSSPNLTTASLQQQRLLGQPNVNGLYWRLGKIKPGRYWIGVMVQTAEGADQVEAHQENVGSWDVFLNGRLVHLATLSNPVQVSPGHWYAEAQSAFAEKLKEGDAIAFAGTHGRFLRVARLTLYPREPERGVARMRVNTGQNTFHPEPNLGLGIQISYLPAEGRPIYSHIPDRYFGPQQWVEAPEDLRRDDKGLPLVEARLFNPLPVALEVDFECVVKGHFLKEVGRDTARLTLPPNSTTIRLIPFDLSSHDENYFTHATLTAVQPPDLGWPQYNTISFFPGLRQMIPWVDPFRYTAHRRLGIKRVAEGSRYRLALHGTWEGAFTRDLNPPMPPPSNLKFHSMTVPPQWMRFEHYDDPDANALYLRGNFVLPEGAENSFAQIVVDGVASEATVYINGQRVGNIRGSRTALVADATSAIRSGTNQIYLVVRNKLAITNPDYVKDDGTEQSILYMDAPGNVYKQMMTYGGVWLEVMPRVAAHEIKIETSVRHNTIRAQMQMQNAGDKAVALVVRTDVLDGDGKLVRSLGEQKLSLGAGETCPMTFVQKWNDPKLWSWQQPNLYVLAVTTRNAETGEPLDLARERFGFRECWIEGSHLIFNGHPIRLQGVVNTGGAMFMQNAPPLSRDTFFMVDTFDETGCLSGQLITGLVNTPSKYNVESDLFWETTEANALMDLKRYWNHPSIIAWDLSNEWHYYAFSTGADMELCARRFLHLSQVVEQLDPTRWTFFNGDYDIDGGHTTLSAHYLTESVGRDPSRGWFNFDGHSTYFPDGAFLKPFGETFQPGEQLSNARGIAKYTYGSKPIMDTENIWKVSGYMPPGSSKFIGEDCVNSLTYEVCAEPFLWMWKQNFDGHRDLDMAIHCNHDGWIPGITARAQLPQTFIMPDSVHHGFSGREIVRDYSLLNDLFRPADLSFQWRLVGPDGQVAAKGEDKQHMQPAQTHRAKMRLTLPEVAGRTTYTLELRLFSEGEFICGEDRDIEVWPDAPAKADPLQRRVWLFDPRGTTAPALQSAGVEFKVLPEIDTTVEEPEQSLVVIGEGALDESSAGQCAELDAFIEQGGHVVVLAQTNAPAFSTKLFLEPREWVSQPYIRLPVHPLLAAQPARGWPEITTWDLHFWAPDRVTARGSYAKPRGGPIVPLVDSGTESGLEYSQLLEGYYGRGMYLLCQLPLVRVFNEEPLARELFARTINYAGGQHGWLNPTHRLRLIATPDDLVESRMREVGVQYDLVTAEADLDLQSPTLFEVGAASVPAAQLTAWHKQLQEGATLVVLGATSADADWLEKLAGKPVQITIPRFKIWEGRANRRGYHPLTAGLSQLDLYWKQFAWNANNAEVPGLLVEQIQNRSVSVDGGREFIFPGALVELPVGAGRLILDQRRWFTTHKQLYKSATRNLAALALGLGVDIAPPPQTRKWPDRVAYRPIDLTPYANRSLVDEEADDGRGGWSDQGPTADLRTLPTGRQIFGKIPFDIQPGSNSIIVLKSSYRPPGSDTPEEVIIPLGYPVEGLAFLHSSAYAGRGNIALYQILYEDGKTIDIPLICKMNMFDWTDIELRSLQNDQTTESEIAWQGSCPMFKSINLLLMRGANPYPETPVKAVRFAIADGEAVPILIGLTAVVQPSVAVSPEDQAAAQDLLQQARQSAPAQAKELLQKALNLQPDLSAAHQALADLCEQDGDENELIRVYRQWTATAPKMSLPWTRLGQLLEKKKDFQGALDAYNQSLEIEWNQPPVIEAKTRMEQTLSKDK